MQFAFAEQESVRQGMTGADAGDTGGYGVNRAWKSLLGRTWTVSTGGSKKPKPSFRKYSQQQYRELLNR